ncbi:MAG: ATP-binding cassette domain-containing protein [Xanthobacteraceae bacterium]
MSPAGGSSRLELHIRQKSYRTASGSRLHVLGEIAFSLARGEVAALVGPSGCGKTTLLRIVVGLDRDFDGSVALPAHGRLGMVFQEPRLLPWRTVEENVRLIAPHVSEAALAVLFTTLGLAEHRRHYPGELSLGLARRVALARAFAIEPDLLVLDEPFVSLDAALVERLRGELIELVSRRPTTTLLVTHSIDEAVGLADRVILLSASPARVLSEVPVEHPRSARSATEIAIVRDRLKSAAAQR